MKKIIFIICILFILCYTQFRFNGTSPICWDLDINPIRTIWYEDKQLISASVGIRFTILRRIKNNLYDVLYEYKNYSEHYYGELKEIK
jgi:hypothetical protein